MFDYGKKYQLVKYAYDCGTDDGMDCDTKKEAETWARRYRRDGWETIACINAEKRRIEFVIGEPAGVLSWFVDPVAAILRENTIIPEYLYI